MNIAITGGSGFIGTALSRKLINSGHSVTVYDRIAPRFSHERMKFIEANLVTDPAPASIASDDAIVHLAGVSIYERWTNVYKPYPFKLSLYKHNQDKKAYLNFDSDIEKDFLEFLEKNKDNIEWWWQNGNEHMNLNFGIKYNGGSTFQPDFLVMFKDGRLGIFDTKASGDREDSNKLKAEALQKYIQEENKKKGKKLFGGLVIKNRDHFMINSDQSYQSFKESAVVLEKGKKYGEVEQRGWMYLNF